MVPFRYEFFPVGQGLFSYGILEHPRTGTKVFSWVYDCGSATAVVRTRISSGIERIKELQEPAAVSARAKSKIDLVFLSHFDDDHISGIKQLLGEFVVDTLVLPYMSFEQLILIAIEEGIDGDHPVFPFFTDPVNFLTSIEGANIARILFVPPSGTEGPALYPEGTVTPPEDPRGFVDYDKISTPSTDHTLSAVRGVVGPQVRILNPGAAILVDEYWEFIPYNDDPQRAIDETFTNAVLEKRDALLSTGEDPERAREDALQVLKGVYDKHFGKNGESRNVISLFLYSGPKGPLELRPPYWPAEAEIETIAEGRSGFSYHWRGYMHWENGSKVSVLYTGDGYLDTSKRLDRMMNYLKKERIDRCAVFQVMHHGAEGNWHKGVAEAISPSFSVFSSDPFRGKWQHPHAPVLRDFWTYGPVQVDQQKGFAYGVWCWI